MYSTNLNFANLLESKKIKLCGVKLTEELDSMLSDDSNQVDLSKGEYVCNLIAWAHVALFMNPILLNLSSRVKVNRVNFVLKKLTGRKKTKEPSNQTALWPAKVSERNGS